MALCLAAPFTVRVIDPAPASGAFRAAFLAMAMGVPFSFVCLLVIGVTLPKPESLFHMPLLRAALVLGASPLLLRAIVAAIGQLIPGYADGPRGMAALASYLNVVLLSAGLFAGAAALTAFVIVHRRQRLAGDAGPDRAA